MNVRMNDKMATAQPLVPRENMKDTLFWVLMTVKPMARLPQSYPVKSVRSCVNWGDDLNSLASFLFNLAFGEGRIFVVNNTLNVKAAIELAERSCLHYFTLYLLSTMRNTRWTLHSYLYTCVPRPVPFGVVIHKAKQPKQIDQRLCEGNAPANLVTICGCCQLEYWDHDFYYEKSDKQPPPPWTLYVH